MSPWNMKNSVKKLEAFDNDQIILRIEYFFWI